MLRLAGSGFVAFRYREYRVYWLAAAFSNVGMWALVYGRLWLMHDMTDSALWVGLVTTANLGPVLLLSMWGGVVADRVNRLTLIRWTRGMFAVLAVVTGVLIATGAMQPWHLIAISVGTGALLSFDIPSRSAMLPALVPRDHLASAIALYSFVFGSAAIIGPAIFSPLVALWGIEGVFFLIGAAYVLTVGALVFMDASGHRPRSRPSTMVEGLRDGFRYVHRHRVIEALIAMGLVMGVFGASYETLLPVFSDRIITGGIDTYGRLLLSAGIGGLIATSSVAVLGVHVRPARYLVVAAVGYGLALLMLSRVSSFPAAMLAVGLIGGFRVVFGTMNVTLIQSLAADEFRGRVMSIHQFSWGAAALGSLLMGALGETVGAPLAMMLGGSVVAGAALLAATTALRRLVAHGIQGPVARSGAGPVS